MELKKYLLIPILLLSGLLTDFTASAQQVPFYTPTPVNSRLRRREIRDSLLNHKHLQRAFIEFGITELAPFSLDRFIRHADFAQITWKTTGYNLNPAHWAWDNDPFQTNQFGHPYHGSLFYNAFRTNGYSFWQSVPAAFAGSYLWETFAESQPPAPNDFINTSFGGIVLGEMTYRMSNKIVNNHTRGFHRQMSEVVALLVSPTNGLNRILDGKWGRVSPNTLEVDSSKISAEFDLGYRKFNTGNQSLFGSNGQTGWYAHAKLLYGSRYQNFSKPFSNIIINAEVGKDDSTFLNTVSVYGSIAGWQLDTAETIKHLLVISANYDYIANSSFFYGGESVKANLYSQFVPFRKVKLSTQLSAGPILLAAIPSPYSDSGRNYDYGSGFGIGGGATLSLLDKFFFTANYRGGYSKTLNGSHSHYFLHSVSGEFSYMPVNHVSANIEPGYVTLEGNYRDHPEFNRNYPYVKISARWAVNIR